MTYSKLVTVHNIELVQFYDYYKINYNIILELKDIKEKKYNPMIVKHDDSGKVLESFVFDVWKSE